MLRPSGRVSLLALAATISGCGSDKTPTQLQPPPPPVTFLTFGTVSPGDAHTCGITTDGTSYCWGDNSDGQLGDGTTSDRSTPAAVPGGLSFITVGAGYRHTCGVTNAGAPYCWGRN